MDNNFIVQLIARLDASKTKTDLKSIESDLNARGINLIIDLVMNHTSSEHPWFQAACDYIKRLNGAEPSEECDG